MRDASWRVVAEGEKPVDWAEGLREAGGDRAPEGDSLSYR